jgi:ABC-type phosphate/phosphonate transport system substrate-binding protein
MQPITLLVPDSLCLGDAELLDLHRAVLDQCGVSLAPVRVASSDLLPEILTPDAIAWAPPWIAFLLGSLNLATPLVSASRASDRGPRSSILVARAGIDGLPALAGSRMGWVSRRSVTGFLLPRLYVESFGVDVDALFLTQRFCGSHESAAEALASGRVDAIATDSRRLGAILERTRARVLASIGPLPTDLLVAGCAVPLAVREGLSRGMHGLWVAETTFARARAGHLDLFELLGRGAPRESPDTNSESLANAS